MRSALLTATQLSLALLPPVSGSPFFAQEAPSPGGPPPASDAPAQPVNDSDALTLNVNVNLVNLYFSARDKDGFITNLRKDECALTEDKVPQTLKNFTQEKNLPLTIGILLDTSGSQMNVLPLEKESGATFLRDVLTPKDEAFLISFDINVDLLSDYTNSPRELKRAIDKATINTGAGTGSVTGHGEPRGTLLYDAVYLAAHDKLSSQAGRKVLILLTDGGDQGSQETLATATEAAQRSNAILYVILLSAHPFADNFADTTNPKSAMDHLARSTGGRVIDVGNSGPKLESAFTQIQDELRTQYRLTYTPTTPADNKFHPQEITCGPHHTVDTRKGYYALPTDPDATSTPDN